MRRKQIMTMSLVLVGLLLVFETNAQSVPASVRREITALLKSHDTFCSSSDVTIAVDAVKITTRKTGYIGSCRFGGGPSVLFERTATGFTKLLAVDTGMNGYLYQEKRLTKGYYDFAHSERGGSEVEVTTYKWNGTRYVAGRPRTVRV